MTTTQCPNVTLRLNTWMVDSVLFGDGMTPGLTAVSHTATCPFSLTIRAPRFSDPPSMVHATFPEMKQDKFYLKSGTITTNNTSSTIMRNNATLFQGHLKDMHTAYGKSNFLEAFLTAWHFMLKHLTVEEGHITFRKKLLVLYINFEPIIPRHHIISGNWKII